MDVRWLERQLSARPPNSANSLSPAHGVATPLEAIFRHKVFKMLLAKGRITRDLIAMLSNWRHSGFQVFCGQRIFPRNETAMENLARYIIRASFSQERMQYLPKPAKVVYRAKDGTEERVFDAPVSSTGQALEWPCPVK